MIDLIGMWMIKYMYMSHLSLTALFLFVQCISIPVEYGCGSGSVKKHNFGTIIVLLFWARREGFTTHGAEATVLIFCGGHANQKTLVGIYTCI